MRIKALAVFGLVAGTAFVGCKQSDSDSAEADKGTAASTGSTEEQGSTQVGEVNISTDPLATLNLSASLSPQVPASVTASGEGLDATQAGEVAISTLRLADRKKSREACNIRQKIKEAKMNQDNMAMQLCFIEAQRGMKAGGKYKMKFSSSGAALTQELPPDLPPQDDPDMTPPAEGQPTDTSVQGDGPGDLPPGGPADDSTAGGPGDLPEGGPGDMPAGGEGGPGDMEMAVFLDNSVPDVFTVSICSNGKMAQKISVSGAGSKGAKGSYKAAMDFGGSSFTIQGAFDNGVEVADHQRSVSQIAFDMNMGSSTMHARSSIALDLVEDGISVVKSANEFSSKAGDFGGSTRELGAALIGPQLGSALFQTSGDMSDGGAAGPADGPAMPLDDEVTTTRSYFDNAGQTLAQEDSAAFAEGGALYVGDDQLPKLVPDDFKVEFDASDWDCSGAEDFAVDEQSEAFKACEERFAAQFEQETCTQDLYAIGGEAPDVPSAIDQREVGAPDLSELPPPPPPPAE